MRVLVISEPGRDGVFFFVRSLIHHLLAKHPETTVDFAYSRERGGAELEELVRFVEKHGGTTIDLGITNAPQLADFSAMGKILRIVHERKPDVIHAHSSKAGALARIAALCPGYPPVLYTPHAYYGMARKGGIKERFYNALESLLGRTGTTHNCSEDEQAFALQTLSLPPDSLVVIHNGIDTSRFSPADEATRLLCRRELGIPETGRLLVSVGRDAVQKNYAPLYEALNGFLPGSEVFFAHAGAGSPELRERLSEKAKERCFAYEHLDDPCVLLRAADGFILTSLYEGLSLSMLHALSCALSVILTEAPGFRLLSSLGFQDILWLPNPAENQNFVKSVRTGLEAWAVLSRGHRENQRKLTCELFNEPVQLEKMFSLYQSLQRRKSN